MLIFCAMDGWAALVFSVHLGMEAIRQRAGYRQVQAGQSWRSWVWVL